MHILESEPKTAFVFPGQGVQRVGMGQEMFASRNPDIATIARRTFEEAEDLLGRQLSSLCLNGPQEELDQPGNIEPSILVTSIAALRALGYYNLGPEAVAGLSLGEFSAVVAAESITFAQAVNLVKARSEFMEEAGRETPGAMVSMIKMNLPEVEEICQQFGVEVANILGDEHIVVSGRRELILQIIEKYGKQARKINVSIASHSSLMEPARKQIEIYLESELVADPKIPFVQNVTGKYAPTGDMVRRGLVDQMTGRVLWLDTIKLLRDDAGIKKYIEVGPGDVLSKLIRRIDPNASLHRTEQILE